MFGSVLKISRHQKQFRLGMSFPGRSRLVMILRHWVPLLILSAWTNNVCLAAQQYRQIVQAKAKPILSATAAIGGGARGNANGGSGGRFPVIPAGASTATAGAGRAGQVALVGRARTGNKTLASVPVNMTNVTTTGPNKNTAANAAKSATAPGSAASPPVPAAPALPGNPGTQQQNSAGGNSATNSKPSGAPPAQSQ